MNILYIFPPQWIPIQPHFAIPSLMGQFRDSKHNVTGMDLNLDFYLKILNKDYIQQCIKNAKEAAKELEKEIKTSYKKEIGFENYPMEEKNKFLKFIIIHNFFKNNEKELYNYPFLLSEAINIMRSPEYFYNPKLLIDSLNIIDKCLMIASLEYAPSTLSLSSFYNQHFKYNYENINYFVNDKNLSLKGKGLLIQKLITSF